jgi:CopG antitoxin of type II toxin-antitoxin system
MARNDKRRDAVLHRFASIEEFNEFWDKHDITDYPEVWRETDLKLNLLAKPYVLTLDPELGKRLETVARARRTSVKRLVNQWLEERLRTA